MLWRLSRPRPTVRLAALGGSALLTVVAAVVIKGMLASPVHAAAPHPAPVKGVAAKTYGAPAAPGPVSVRQAPPRPAPTPTSRLAAGPATAPGGWQPAPAATAPEGVDPAHPVASSPGPAPTAGTGPCSQTSGSRFDPDAVQAVPRCGARRSVAGGDDQRAAATPPPLAPQAAPQAGSRCDSGTSRTGCPRQRPALTATPSGHRTLASEPASASRAPLARWPTPRVGAAPLATRREIVPRISLPPPPQPAAGAPGPPAQPPLDPARRRGALHATANEATSPNLPLAAPPAFLLLLLSHRSGRPPAPAPRHAADFRLAVERPG